MISLSLYSNLSYLQKHIQRIHEEKRYQCKRCEETFSTPRRWFCEVCYTTRYGEIDQYGDTYNGEDICLKCVPVEDATKSVVNQ